MPYRVGILVIAVATAACTYSARLDVERLSCDGDRPCPNGEPCSADGYCRASPDAGVADAARPATYDDVVLADQPILYVRLEDATAAQQTDSSGNQRHGTRVGELVAADGVADGQAAIFDTGDRVYWADDSALRLDGSFTIELWAELVTPLNTYPGLVRKGYADGAGYLIFYVAGDERLVFKRGNSSYSSEEFLLDSRLRHLVVTYDSTSEELRWYVDGLQSVQHDQVVFPVGDSMDLNLGIGDEAGNHLIDEFALYDRPLSADEVFDHYAAAATSTSR